MTRALRAVLVLIAVLAAPRAAVAAAADAAAIRAHDGISILDYGARCDGTTDDAPAINAAAADWRRAHAARRGARLVFPQRGVCLIRSPIDLTNVFARGARVDGGGVVILCETGGICIDATGDTGIDYADIVLRGSRRHTPRIGIQWARESDHVGCSEDNARNLVVTGDFSFAAIYVEACEDMSWTNAYIENGYAAGPAWLVVEDGFNHWRAQSPFQDITIGDRPHGMDELVWTNPLFFQKGPGHMMWLGNSHSTELIGEAYGNSDFGAAPFVLYGAPHTNNGNLVVEMHIEERHQESVFDLEGTDPDPVINGLRWHERGAQPVGAIFTHGPLIRSVRLQDVDLRIDQSYVSRPPWPRIFADPAAWSMSGDVFLPSLAWWTTPAHWTGCITTLTSPRACSLGGVTALPAGAGAQALAFAVSGDTAYDITAAAPLALTLSGGAPGQAQRLTLVLREPPGQANPVTLPPNVTWVGPRAAAPPPAIRRAAVVTFLTVDGGRSYFGWID